MPKIAKSPTACKNILTPRHAPTRTSGDYDPTQFRHNCSNKCDTKHRWHACSYKGCGHITKQAGNMKTHELRAHTLITFPCKAGCSGFRWVDPARHTRHLQVVHGQAPAPQRRTSNCNGCESEAERGGGKDVHDGSVNDRASSVSSSASGFWSTSDASSSSLVSSRLASPLGFERSVHSVSFTTGNIEELKEFEEMSCNCCTCAASAQDPDVPISSFPSTSMAVSFTEMLNMPWSAYASLSALSASIPSP